jgi:hypothetical protein
MSEAQHPMDRLSERARVRGASRTLPEGATAADVTPQIAAEVVRLVREYKRERNLTLKQIARGVALAESTISQVLAGKYAGDARAVVIDLDRWLDEQQSIDAAPKPASFVWTGVARKIETVARAAVEMRTIGLVYGPETSGLGKSTALQAIAAERPGCVHITIDKVDASATGLIYQLCRALRLDNGNRVIFHKIAEKLAGTSRLLIVDQIHNLCGVKGDKPFFMLADLHERTKAPQLWAGTTNIVSYLLDGQRQGREPLSQIRSRIGISCELTQGSGSGGGGDDSGPPLFTVDEIRAIFAQNKMRLAPDAARYLARLANLRDSGALRTCKNLVVMATTLYQSRGDVLTEEMLRSAHRLLVPDEAYAALQREIDNGKATGAAQIAVRAG